MSSAIRVDPVEQSTAHGWELTVTGELDLSTVAKFDEALDAVVERGARFVVLDLRHVEFLDSTGLRSIVRAADLMAERGGRLTVAGLSGAAEQVLRVTGVLEHLRHGEPDDAGDGTDDT